MEYKAEDYITFIEQGRRDKISPHALELIAKRFRELEASSSNNKKQDIPPTSDSIRVIAESYHDRLVMTGLSLSNQICGCCGNETNYTTKIEHDSQDYSKDLSVCLDCYKLIVDYWKENKPRKISPI